jgi:hypothetical protein
VPEGRNAPGITYALVAKLAREMDKKTVPPIITYIRRLAPEFGVVCVRDATARDETLAEVKAMQQWLAEHLNLMVG